MSKQASAPGGVSMRAFFAVAGFLTLLGLLLRLLTGGH